MNLSFFRRRKSQSSAISSTGVETEEHERFPSSVATEADRPSADSVSADSSEQLELPLDVVLPLLPEAVVNRRGSIEGAPLVRLSLKQILPQLAKGRVMVSLGDILKQLPAELLTSALPYTGSEKIQIPLDRVVAHISPDRLQMPKGQEALELSEDEIPSPFTEDNAGSSSDWLQAQTPTETKTPSEQSSSGMVAEARSTSPTPAPEEASAVNDISEPQPIDSKPLFEPVEIRDETPAEQPIPGPAVSDASEEWRKQWIYIPLGDLLESVPDSALTDARPSLASRLDLNFKVPVQLEEIAAQLSRGRITLDLSKVAKRLPEDVLLAEAEGEISIGIDKVIDQLPEAVFQAGHQDDVLQGIGEIPTPFKEKPEDHPRQMQPSPVTPPPAAEVKLPRKLEPRPEPTPSAERKAVELSAPVPEFTNAVPASERKQGAVESRAEEIPTPPNAPPRIEVSAVAPIPVEERADAEPVVPATDSEAQDLDTVAMTETTEAASAESVPASRTVTKEEIAAVVSNLNTWTETDLHHHGIGPTLAQRILEFRAQGGGFKDPRDLLQIAGIGPKLFRRVLGFNPDELEDQTRAINRLLDVSEDHEMTLQEIVKCTSQLPGVEGCIVAMSDGLYMTGELPERFDTQRVSAFAPQLFARVSQYVRELNVGTARRFTIFTDAQPITIFKSNNLFFIVIHKANRFSKVLLNKCARVSQEISRICSQENAKG